MPGKDYISEIEGTFDDKISAKEALKIAKTIKSTHKLAYPKKEFKNILKGRLQESYFISQADELGPRFSIFQIIGALGSFIFIAGALTTLYNIREIPKAAFLQEKVIQETQVLDDTVSPTYNEDDNIEVQTLKQIESITEIPDNIEEVPYLESKSQFIVPEKAEIIPEAAINSHEETEALPSSGAAQESVPASNPNELFKKAIGEDEEGSSEDAAGSAMFFDELSEVESVGLDIDFSEICGEYNGVIDIETNTCTLPSGTVCLEDTIYECAQGDTQSETDSNVDIFLEEPNSESGQ